MSDDYHDAQTVRAIDKLRDLGRTDLAESVSRTLQMSKERRAQIVDDNNTIIALRARVAELEAALAKREAVAGGVVWQARARGCSEWSDVGAEHAERLRTCSWLVRAVVVVSPESDTPVNQRELYAAPPQPAEEELKCDQCGKVCNNPWHGSTETNRHTHACDECHKAEAKVPEGFVMVPVEPTATMIIAAERAYMDWFAADVQNSTFRHADTYRAMISASRGEQ